jgi:hypothetical protein
VLLVLALQPGGWSDPSSSNTSVFAANPTVLLRVQRGHGPPRTFYEGFTKRIRRSSAEGELSLIFGGGLPVPKDPTFMMELNMFF